MKRLLFLSFLVQFSCVDFLSKSQEDEEDEDDERQEGERQGDCVDGSDNDDDGAIDCDDSGCADKPACEAAVETDTAVETEPSVEVEPSTEPSNEEDTAEEIDLLLPVAIGFQYSGIWNEAANDGEGALQDYLFPDLNGTNGGNPLPLANLVTVTLASVEFFSLDTSATDEERKHETCTIFADFSYSPAEIPTDNWDWSSGFGGAGDFDTTPWQAFEGTLIFRMDTASERCNDLENGYSLEIFDGMHFGLVFGGLSNYMLESYETTSWWAGNTDAQNAYFTQYIAVNHGNDFTAYDWASSIFIEADPNECDSNSGVCGLIQTQSVSGNEEYVLGNLNQNIGSRYGYVQGTAWWYEDFPNLDFNTLQDH